MAAGGVSGIDMLGIDAAKGCSDDADSAYAPGHAADTIVKNMPIIFLIIQKS